MLVSVRRRLRGGSGVVCSWGVPVCGGGLGAMSQRRVSPHRAVWGASRRRLRTCGSCGAGSWRGALPGDAAHPPPWLPMRLAASIPSLVRAGGSPTSPCRAGGPGRRWSALRGPISAAPTAVCGSSAATTVLGRARGRGRGRGCGYRRVCARRGRGAWRRRWVWGSTSPCIPVLWGCVGSGCVLGTTRTSLRGWGGAGGCGGDGACAGSGETWGAGMGVGARLRATGVAPT